MNKAHKAAARRTQVALLALGLLPSSGSLAAELGTPDAVAHAFVSYRL